MMVPTYAHLHGVVPQEYYNLIISGHVDYKV